MLNSCYVGWIATVPAIRLFAGNKGKLCFIFKRIYRRVRLYSDIGKIFRFCNFIEIFTKLSNLVIFEIRKNFRFLEYRRVIRHFEARSVQILNI